MARRRNDTGDFDSPWKDALQAYLPQFLAFFFADIHAGIDWRQGFQALDKEFQQIARRAKVGKCLADKLFKVWLKDGRERWLLIHVEVQGEFEKEFPKRMFEYNIAAHRRYNQTVVSLAVLCDDNPQWRPATFSYGEWGYKLELTFGCAKLLDYVKDWPALEASTNPFAALVQAHWQAKRTRDDADSRHLEKVRLVKALYRKNWTSEQVRQLFRLIDWIMALPEPMEEQFWTEIHQFEQEIKMPYITSVERIGYKKGKKEGLEQGKEVGLEQGKEEGLEEGKKAMLEAISVILETKFGKPGLKLMPHVRKLDLAELRQITGFISTANSLQEVRDYLAE